MKIDATRIISEPVRVDIDSYALMEHLFLHIENLLWPKDICHYGDAFYINADGKWESWEDGGGSGMKEIFRDATAEEIHNYDMLISSKRWMKEILTAGDK